jgi:cytochrome c-type biogenesis protein CcmE
MTRKQSRTAIILASLSVIAVAVGIILFAMRDTIVFFYTPSDIIEKAVKPGTRIRLGGMVQAGSWQKPDATHHVFVVTDTLKSTTVTYIGLMPDLFREGQGVVTEGVIDAGGNLTADTVLAKHDENYMPKDVADRLKERGVKLGKGSGS